MHNPNHDPSSIPVAELVEPDESRISIGCILAIIFSAVGVLGAIVMGVIVYFVINDLSDVAQTNRPRAITESALREDAISELERTKAALLKPIGAQQHPQYNRIQKFVESAQSVLDETPNPRLQKLVDYDGYLSELANRCRLIDNNRLSQMLYLPSLKQNIVGPSPFNSFEILQIEDEGPDRYRVYLSCQSDYQSTDPFIWWVSDKENRLKIYDWEQLEFGLRATLESAIIADASGAEEAAYEKYSADSDEYFASYYEQGADRRPQRVRQILTRCEQFAGPQLLRPNVQLVTAYRWYTEDENERALKMLDSIMDDQMVPGVHRLRGEIEFEQGQFEAAANSFAQFTKALGPLPFAQKRLANCYRELGDAAAERKAILAMLDSISESDFDSVASLIELNSKAENVELFARLDELPNHEEVYTFLINTFDGSPFFVDKLQHLVEHLDKTIPDSQPAQLGKIKLKSGLEGLKASLKLIDRLPDDDLDETRYNFWYGLDEDQVVELFESSDRKQINFESISHVCDYEGIISDDVMTSVCNSLLKSDPENFRALYHLGSIRNQAGEFELALTDLTQAEELMPPGDELENSLRYELMHALFGNGEQDKAIRIAVEHDLIEGLFSLMNENDDFSGYSNLLKHLEVDSNEFKYHNALLDHHKGDSESALRALADLVKATDSEENFVYASYQAREKLLEICSQLNDPTRAVTLAPTEEMFSRVSEQIVKAFDWPNCEKLLQLEDNRLNDSIFKLRQTIYWEQGQYDKVLDNADRVMLLAKEGELDADLIEQLVRSAIRLGKLDLAGKYVDQCATFSGVDHLSLLVAILQRQPEDVIRQYRQLPGYQSTRALYDHDLGNVDVRDVVSLEKLPPRQLGYASFGLSDQQFELELLFKQKVELGEDQLKQAFAGFDEGVRIEKVDSVDSISENWIVATSKYRILVSQRPLKNPDLSGKWENDDLKDAIASSKFLLSIKANENEPLTSEARYDDSIELIRRFMSPDLMAVGDDSQWLAADDLARYFDHVKANEPPSLRPFRNGEFSGEFYYLSDDVEDTSSEKFLETMSTALRKFRDSTDPNKKLIVRLNVKGFIPERINAVVDRINRTGYRTVELVVIIQEDARFDRSIRKGDQFIVPLLLIDGFELTTSGEVQKYSRSSD